MTNRNPIGLLNSVIDTIIDNIAEITAEKIYSKTSTVLEVPAQTLDDGHLSSNNYELQDQIEDLELKVDYLTALATGEVYRGEFPQVPPKDTCWSCLWFSGRICHRERAPKVHKVVLIWTPACPLYTYTEHPRALLTSVYGKGDGIQKPARILDYISNEVQNRRSKKRKAYTIATCSKCGKDHTVNKNGKLYPHDVNGISFRLGHGDRTKPCDGAPVRKEES